MSTVRGGRGFTPRPKRRGWGALGAPHVYGPQRPRIHSAAGAWGLGGLKAPHVYGPPTFTVAFWTALPAEPSAVSSSSGRLGATVLVYLSTPFW